MNPSATSLRIKQHKNKLNLQLGKKEQPATGYRFILPQTRQQKRETKAITKASTTGIYSKSLQAKETYTAQVPNLLSHC